MFYQVTLHNTWNRVPIYNTLSSQITYYMELCSNEYIMFYEVALHNTWNRVPIYNVLSVRLHNT